MHSTIKKQNGKKESGKKIIKRQLGEKTTW